MVVALVIAVLAVESIDHDTPVVAAEGAPVATTAPESDGSPRSGPTTTTEPQISITVEPDPVAEEDLPGPSGEAPPVVTPDPVTPPPGNPVPPPPPPPAAPTAELSISPSHLAPTVSSGAVLSWSTGNATTVSVSGSGVSSSAPSGSQTVCPGSSGSVCIPAVGTYTYVLTASGPGGSVQRSVTLTVS